MNEQIFDRTQASSGLIGANAYNFIIGLTLLWGLGVNWWMVTNIEPQSIAAIPRLVFFVGYFASCLMGIYLFNRSGTPIVSFIGYNLVVVPFGFIVNLVVNHYDPEIVAQALRITAMVTAAMMLLGTLYPAFFERIAGALCLALFLVVIVELVEIVIFRTHHGVIDWIVVLLFCGYIGYDWARANAIPKTVDNAIDSAAALYMDIINLFLRTLRILGRK